MLGFYEGYTAAVKAISDKRNDDVQEVNKTNLKKKLFSVSKHPTKFG